MNFLAETLGQLGFSSSPVLLLMFMAHLRLKGLKASTISSYVSGLRYVIKMQGCIDPGNNFMVASALTGLAKSESSLDIRLPITVSILRKLIHMLEAVVGSSFELPNHLCYAALTSIWTLQTIPACVLYSKISNTTRASVQSP
jgi:hypothetical protein